MPFDMLLLRQMLLLYKKGHEPFNELEVINTVLSELPKSCCDTHFCIS